MAEYIHAQPAIVTKDAYEGWVKKDPASDKYNEILASDGEFLVHYLTTDNELLWRYLALIWEISVGLPQNAAGKGDNSFKILHGTEVAPPHAYDLLPYLWSQYGFGADTLIHLEPRKFRNLLQASKLRCAADDWLIA